LLDKLISSSPSRVINVIGVGYNRVPIGFQDFNLDNTYVAADAYKRSKLALAMFTNELAKRLEGKQKLELHCTVYLFICSDVACDQQTEQSLSDVVKTFA
jgi:NAD(P)-dependent dehydrogenase (short-subunit alcohol dehydrogenase family)